MQSSSARAVFSVALLAAALQGSPARAQGFAVERFSPSPAGAGWLVMDALELCGELGGALNLTTGYAQNPLRVGPQRLAVVSDQAFANFGLAITWDRFRLSLDTAMPLVIAGKSGSVGAAAFEAPAVSLASNPDTLSDYRVGLDARLLGAPGGPFRLGLGVALIIPSGTEQDWDTDGTFRAVGRVLFAGDVGRFTYAGHLGVHVRPRDDGAGSFGPRGSELLFGVAAGARLALVPAWSLVVGPELFGQTAFRAFFGTEATGVEALLSGRLESEGEGARLRVRLGVGAGLDPGFGTPQWRVVLGAELFGRAASKAPAGP